MISHKVESKEQSPQPGIEHMCGQRTEKPNSIADKEHTLTTGTDSENSGKVSHKDHHDDQQ